jgi:hypothetical protein
MDRADELEALAWNYECEGIRLAKVSFGTPNLTECAANNFAVAAALRALAATEQ